MKSLTVLVLCVSLRLVSSKSFTLVIDTSGSMQNDIIDIKRNIKSVLEAIRGRPHIQNFILVPFSDSGTGNPIITNNSESFLGSINALTASGISDCPENTLAGIRKGLEVSYSESYIYVFTDAFAKDYDDVSAIQNLCKSTRSQVTILLSGYCRPDEGSFDIYKDIAKYCSGTVIQFDSRNYRKAFDYIIDIATIEWTKVVTYAPISDRFEFEFSVYSLTSSLVIVATGAKPWIFIDGHTRNDDTLIYDRKALMVANVKADVGTYRASVRCEICSTVTIYQRNILPFHFGFSQKLVKHFKETTLKPIPDATNYFLISSTMTINSVKMETFNGRPGTDLTMEPVPGHTGMYYTTIFVSSSERFRIVIYGYESRTAEISIGSTKILEPQRSDITQSPRSPTIEIISPENTLMEFASHITIASRITAFPKPDIWWENSEGQQLPSEDVLLEMSSVYISYVTIETVTRNDTLFCKSKNSEGEESQSIDIFVNRTAILDIEQSPTDDTFEYGSEGRLYCKAISYPETNLKWYHNDSLIESSEDIEIIPEDNTLVIKSMRLEDVGTYKCEVSNSIDSKTLSALISISGLESPELETDQPEIDLKPEDSADITCRIKKGSPKPAISWHYKSESADAFGEVPDDVKVDEGTLTISSVKAKHSGTYKCVGSNDVGEDSQEVVVRIRYAPTISDSKENVLVVLERHEAVLSCQVNAEPKAHVRWELSQHDVIVALNERFHIDEQNTLRFFALWKDSGNYHCIAENELGSTEKIIKVNVLVPPHIQEPPSDAVTAAVGETVTLICYVPYGNPVPTTRWEFTATNSSSPAQVLSRGNATNSLKLAKVTKAHEGSYLCVAENSVDKDRIKIDLKVH